MLFGSKRQVEWAENIKDRANSFCNRVNDIRGVIEDCEISMEYREKLIDITDIIFDRVEFINDEDDARALINWYGYLGLEVVKGNKRRRYRESLQKFFEDILSDEADKDLYIEELMKIDKIAK